MDSYGDQLKRIVSSLARKGFPAAGCGDGAARFVYADFAGRAAEVSRDEMGFFVELFEEPMEASLHQFEQEGIEDAIRLVVEWLSRAEA